MALLQPLPDARLMEGVPALQRAGRALISIVLLHALRLCCGQTLANVFSVHAPTLQRPACGRQQGLRICQPQQVQILRMPGPVQPQPLSHLMQRLLPLPPLLLLCRLSRDCRRHLVRQPCLACRTLPDNRCSPYSRGLLGGRASRHLVRRLPACLGGLLLPATGLVLVPAAVCMPAWCRRASLGWCGGHGRPAHSAVPIHALNLSRSCILHSMETGMLNLSGGHINITPTGHMETAHTRAQHWGWGAPYGCGDVQQWTGLASYMTARTAAHDMADNAQPADM